MTLVSAADLVRAAATQNRGVGAFNVIHLETAEALGLRSALVRALS
ncbi:MAG: fructose-bisphosphate aldolase, partial [Actinomycetota bacterium]